MIYFRKAQGSRNALRCLADGLGYKMMLSVAEGVRGTETKLSDRSLGKKLNILDFGSGCGKGDLPGYALTVRKYGSMQGPQVRTPKAKMTRTPLWPGPQL